jgi:hypothetical protein
MPEYIAADVTALRDSDAAADVTLLLGVSGDRDEFLDRIEDAGGTVDATLGRSGHGPGVSGGYAL